MNEYIKKYSIIGILYLLITLLFITIIPLYFLPIYNPEEFSKSIINSYSVLNYSIHLLPKIAISIIILFELKKNDLMLYILPILSLIEPISAIIILLISLNFYENRTQKIYK